MTIRPWLRRALFGMTAVAIVLAAASEEGSRTGQELVQPARASIARQAESKQHVQKSTPRVELERLRRPAAKLAGRPEIGNAFNVISWYVPPPPPPPPPPPRPVPPPAPTAPPMPFSYLGRYEEGGKVVIFLVKGDRIYTVSEGEVIDNTYRVEHLTGGVLEMTYLPLNIKQTISVGES